MIQEKSVQLFLDELAGKSSTPGGGSAAAVTGAMAAALVSMVANFTIGRKGYEEVQAEMLQLLETSESLRTRITALIEADVNAFNTVMAAYGMPRATEVEKGARTAAIQAGLKSAADVPLACARLCAEVLRLTAPVAAGGNRNVVSDAGVAVLAAEAALRSAALNVYVNINAIKDQAFVSSRRAELEQLLKGSREMTEQVYELVKGKL